MTGEVDGKRTRRRSPIRWSDQIHTALYSTIHNALHTVRDRNRWRNMIPMKVMQKEGHDPQHRGIRRKEKEEEELSNLR